MVSFQTQITLRSNGKGIRYANTGANPNTDGKLQVDAANNKASTKMISAYMSAARSSGSVVRRCRRGW
jgi:hypothetical protein